MTEPVIFQNFGSKAALFAAVLDRLAGDVRASLDALAGHHESAASLLAHILTPSDTAASHGPGAHRTLFGDAAALITDPEAGEGAARVARIVAGHLADLVRRGQEDGSVRVDVNPSAAAWLPLSVLATRPLRAARRPAPTALSRTSAASPFALSSCLARRGCRPRSSRRGTWYAGWRLPRGPNSRA